VCSPCELLQVVQIHAGAKGFTRAGQDHNLRGRIHCLLQRRNQVINQLLADGIALVSAIERDRGDAAGFGV
jgi:hypothetical protein